MRLKTTVNKYGQVYVPAKIREAIGLPKEMEADIDYIADMKSILLIPSYLSAKEALKSLEVIRNHLKHEAEIESVAGGTN